MAAAAQAGDDLAFIRDRDFFMTSPTTSDSRAPTGAISRACTTWGPHHLENAAAG